MDQRYFAWIESFFAAYISRIDNLKENALAIESLSVNPLCPLGSVELLTR